MIKYVQSCSQRHVVVSPCHSPMCQNNVDLQLITPRERHYYVWKPRCGMMQARVRLGNKNSDPASYLPSDIPLHGSLTVTVVLGSFLGSDASWDARRRKMLKHCVKMPTCFCTCRWLPVASGSYLFLVNRDALEPLNRSQCISGR